MYISHGNSHKHPIRIEGGHQDSLTPNHQWIDIKGVQGIPEDHPDDSTIFMAGIAQHPTQIKKEATVYPKGFQFNTNRKNLKGKT